MKLQRAHEIRLAGFGQQTLQPDPPPDWFTKALAAFNAVSGWVWPLLAVAGAIILYAPIPDLAQFQRDLGAPVPVLCWPLYVRHHHEQHPPVTSLALTPLLAEPRQRSKLLLL